MIPWISFSNVCNEQNITSSRLQLGIHAGKSTFRQSNLKSSLDEKHDGTETLKS